MYSVLKHGKGVKIPGRPTEIGLMVNGNGGWGRIIFELEDASGQRWTSIGAEQKGEPTRWLADWLSPEEFEALKTSGINDWNTDDPWGRSYVNFEGWRYLKFPLPGKPADMTKPVKVFILLGQSNMLGFGKITGDKPGTLEHAIKKENLYPFLVDDAGNWTERKDVRNVRVMGSGTGNMKVFNNEWMTIKGGRIGPEIGIGHHIGRNHE